MVSVLRPGKRILNILGIGVQTSRRAVASGAAAWWAVAGKTCVAAYQPKGAADYAASKVNLANPGTYNAVDGAAYPTWDATAGWTFNTLSFYLATGIIPAANQTWSALVRFTDATATNYAIPFGAGWTGGNFEIIPNIAAARTYYLNGGVVLDTVGAVSGVLCIAGNKGYKDGAYRQDIPAGTGTNTSEIMIGCRNTAGTKAYYFNGKIQAFAVYSDTLTAGEVATVSAAMAAL